MIIVRKMSDNLQYTQLGLTVLYFVWVERWTTSYFMYQTSQTWYL